MVHQLPYIDPGTEPRGSCLEATLWTVLSLKPSVLTYLANHDGVKKPQIVSLFASSTRGILFATYSTKHVLKLFGGKFA